MKSINDLEIYREAMSLGEEVWSLVLTWDYLAKDTLGKQLIRSADSIAANISEGIILKKIRSSASIRVEVFSRHKRG